MTPPLLLFLFLSLSVCHAPSSCPRIELFAHFLRVQPYAADIFQGAVDFLDVVLDAENQTEVTPPPTFLSCHRTSCCSFVCKIITSFSVCLHVILLDCCCCCCCCCAEKSQCRNPAVTVCTLDLVTALSDVSGGELWALVCTVNSKGRNQSVFELAAACAEQESPQLRQSACALLGTISKVRLNNNNKKKKKKKRL
jgi:hypothetical protein